MPTSDGLALEFTPTLPHLSHSSVSPYLFTGGLFLDSIISPSYLNCIPNYSSSSRNYAIPLKKGKRVVCFKGVFSSVSLKDFTSSNNGGEEIVGIKNVGLEREKIELPKHGAMNPSKHLWAGAVAAMVARCLPTFLRFLCNYGCFYC